MTDQQQPNDPIDETGERLRAALHDVAASVQPTDRLADLQRSIGQPATTAAATGSTAPASVPADAPAHDDDLTPWPTTKDTRRTWPVRAVAAAAVLLLVAGVAAIVAQRARHQPGPAAVLEMPPSNTGWYAPADAGWKVERVVDRGVWYPDGGIVVEVRSPDGLLVTMSTRSPGDELAGAALPDTPSTQPAGVLAPIRIAPPSVIGDAIGPADGLVGSACAAADADWSGAFMIVIVGCKDVAPSTYTAEHPDEDATLLAFLRSLRPTDEAGWASFLGGAAPPGSAFVAPTLVGAEQQLADPTGLYVPTRLPTGWRLAEVEARSLNSAPIWALSARLTTLDLGDVWFTITPRGEPATPEGAPQNGVRVGNGLIVRTTTSDTTCGVAAVIDVDERLDASASCKDAADRDRVQAALSEFLNSLQPVTAAGWATWVQSADQHDPKALVRTVEDLRGDLGSTTTAVESPVTTMTMPSTTTTTAASTTTTEPADGSTNAPNGPMYDDLTGLTFHLDVDGGGTVMSGVRLTARLTVTNSTDQPRTLTECTTIQTTWGLVPESTPNATVPLPDIIDCYRTDTLTVPAHGSAPMSVTTPLAARHVGTSIRNPGVLLGALEPGRYLATAVVPGRSAAGRVQVPVTVTGSACPGSPTTWSSGSWTARCPRPGRCSDRTGRCARSAAVASARR
jgi:hypothetical protein